MERPRGTGGRALKVGLYALAGIVAAILLVGIVASKITDDNQSQMLGVFETRIALQRTFVNVIDQETAIRGYAATHDRRLLEPYFAARKEIVGNFSDLAADGGDALAPEVSDMMRLYTFWRSVVGDPLAGQPDRPDRVAREIHGKFIVDRIRAAGHSARLKLDVILQDKIRASSRIRNVEIGTVVVLVILFGAAGLRFGRERLRVEIRLRETLAERNASLEQSNQSLEEFAYVASHDLQEPLRAISGFTQLLADRYSGKLDAEADEFIGYIVDGTRRMKHLIDDVLQYSRVTTHGRPLVPVDLNAVARRAAQNLQATLAASSAEVTFDDLPEVEGDATQLIQLVQNLIANGVKYNRSRPPRIGIAADRNEEGDWVISVRDNGIGIDPKYQDRIFRIFARLHTREEFGGTGIGLALTRRILERHGGRIWVESVEGHGATFLFTLRPAVAKGLA
ncbi:MAG TPA: ATP-binding protein [Candidatus Acidoferrales bacterium]|nr:ATP-binding protein [Candidatus Acidoferrales bacterium]